ncbi:TonB-dependent siderophore receptor [Luteimonas sp. S4-F44]|uniref:TonB-dependent receptor n=1 Tax=Luteimonas sp. S4-F44 TaxID=2925842 RepID=UPI001F52ED05|nr:TonB-dependent siderophore receptor [Luteimonas sp. S4-F44]UNK42118.1 TonB-dependent siderophore receptor [Luteimonas sp. S4-F44]
MLRSTSFGLLLAPAAPCAFRSLGPLAGLMALALSPSALAQSTPQSNPSPTTLDALQVRGQRLRTLDAPQHTGSRLGLTQRETPASLQVIDREEIARRGARTTREAFELAQGAMVGNVPGNPAVVTLRGFSGNTVSVLHDGVRLGASTFVTRDVDTWSLERMEVLRGPASVLYGEGAMGGAINLVTRRPSTDGAAIDGMLGIGSFGTRRAGLGINQPISDTLAVRIDASGLRADSLYDIERNAVETSTLSASAAWTPRESLSMLLSWQHAQDKSAGTYQGAPMIAIEDAIAPSRVVRSADGLVIDRATRHTNYNPIGAYTSARSNLLRWHTTLALSPTWQLRNDLAYYRADRDFVYSDDWRYDRGTGLYARSVERVVHDHRFWNERLALAYHGPLAGRRNRFTVGVEINDTDFINPRQSGLTTPVTPIDPVLGTFPGADSNAFTSDQVFRTGLRTHAVFVEDAFNLTPRWLLVGGVRYERIDLDRAIDDRISGARTTFAPRYTPLSWRLGSVFDLRDHLQLYGQVSTAASPVSSMLTLQTASGRFDLTDARAAEVGLKAEAWDTLLSLTAAAYRIERDGILTRDPANPMISVQGGRQSSQGLELAADLQATRGLRLEASATWGRARFDELIEAGGFDRRGRRPSNVPNGTASLAATYRFASVPVSLGASGHHVGGFYTDNANTYYVRGRTTFDAWAGYDWPRVSLALRVRNAGDALYGEYSGYPATHVYLGAPRSVEMTLRTRF